jgi:penicillin-binding protein 2
MVWYKSRNNILLVIFLLLFIVLGVRLFWLTGVEGEAWTDKANTDMIRTIRTDSPRGEIFDRNGILLAGNHSTYAVDFSRSSMTNELTNDSVANIIDILARHKEKLIDDFPIKINKKGAYYYTFDTEISKWLKSHKMPADYTAEQAFNELRQQNDIEEGLDAAAAQKKLIELGVTPPISVKNMEFTEAASKRTFLERYHLTGTGKNPVIPTAGEAFDEIVDFYSLREQFPNMDNAQYRSILIIRSALTAQGYLRWMPIKIASDISKETVIEIRERAHDLPGAEVITESVRYYPLGTQASHIIGYLGKISDENKTKYVDELEYKPTDLIGLSGVEKSQESLLRGIDGMKQILVNKSGEMIRQMSEETTAKQGSDIMLTLDMRLQKIAEDSLDEALKGIRTGGTFNSEFGKYKFTEASPQAEVGAAVAIKVKTGEPLAIAAVPDFDPNQFAEGITSENWEVLQGDNPRDPLSPRPLYNVASRTAVQPGSTFKPMIGMVAQELGLDPYRTLYDVHTVTIGTQNYSCLGHHGYVNLFSALQASCNVYFYDVGTGRDWARDGADIGYAKKITPDLITKYAKQFGLGIKTGAEIDETITAPPTKEKKMNSMKALLKQKLLGEAEYLFKKDVVKDYTQLEKNIDDIVNMADENPAQSEIKSRLLELGVKKDEAQSTAEDIKFSYFNYAQWTTGDEFNISIGQGENAYTPLQMARYIATIGNGGKRNSLSLIKAVEGEGEVKRPKAKKSDIDPEYIANVITGMRRVVTNGTLSRGMAGLDVAVAGKTGTATREGHINPPDEAAYVKEHLSGINSALSWSDVKKEMKRLMKQYPRIYSSENIAVRKAVVNLSGRNFNAERIDAYKSTYADFAWVVALAPAEDPEIAVACLIVQGQSSVNAAPVARELIGQYFKLKALDEKNKDPVDYDTFFTRDKLDSMTELHEQEGITSGSGISTAAGISTEAGIDTGAETDTGTDTGTGTE